MSNLVKVEKSLSMLNLKRRLRGMAQPDNSFFVVVMPGGFHIAKLAIDYFPAGYQLILIGNGVDAEEAAWAERSLPGLRVLRTRAMLEHHDVLDAIFAAWRKNFGILDYDCFVFDRSLIGRITDLAPDVSMNAAFFRANRDPELKVPETFLLFFNVVVIRALMDRYRVATRPIRWRLLSPEVKARLGSIGLSESMPPEDHKPYFDTLRLLMMLGVCDGYPYRFIAEIPASPEPREDAFHVGGVSNPRSIKGIWALRGSYFWRRVLEATDDPFLKAHYKKKFGPQGAGALLEENRHLADEIAPEFLAFCERILEDRPDRAGEPVA
jgi:hypothetical protein